MATGDLSWVSVRVLSAQHRSLSAPHSDFFIFLHHFVPSFFVLDFSLVRLEDLFEHELRSWVGAGEGPLQDVKVDSLVLMGTVNITQTEVDHAKLEAR